MSKMTYNVYFWSSDRISGRHVGEPPVASAGWATGLGHSDHESQEPAAGAQVEWASP
jgi:hypothetical protein